MPWSFQEEKGERESRSGGGGTFLPHFCIGGGISWYVKTIFMEGPEKPGTYPARQTEIGKEIYIYSG